MSECGLAQTHCTTTNERPGKITWTVFVWVSLPYCMIQSFENVAKTKYSKITLTNQNSIHMEIESILLLCNSGPCTLYYLISESIKIKIKDFSIGNAQIGDDKLIHFEYCVIFSYRVPGVWSFRQTSTGMWHSSHMFIRTSPQTWWVNTVSVIELSPHQSNPHISVWLAWILNLFVHITFIQFDI